MPCNFDSLDAFAKSFAANWRGFMGFFWTRTDIPDPEKWGILYTKTRHATPIELVNHEHLKHLLWVYLNHKSKHDKLKHVFHIRDRHFASGLTEGFLIRVYAADGRITNACATLYDHLSALREYPVADDEALDKLEAEIFADEWPDILNEILAHFDGERFPFQEDGYRYYMRLNSLPNTEGMSALLLKHNPRAYWSSETGHFALPHFLGDITDGRITIDEIFDAHPANVTPCFSASLAHSA